MSLQLTISKTRSRTALDQQALYKLGLEHIQEIAARVWNDHNIHDPGITTLELLCYAITDLSYRALFPIEDLLASSARGDSPPSEPDSTLFSARTILPCRPLTALDYRKLLIDLKGVKNAWIHPAAISYWADKTRGRLQADEGPDLDEVKLAGLYNVTIEYQDDITDRREEVMEAVKARLHANRNLCEDFESFEVVDTQSFRLCSRIELAPDADTSRIKALIIFHVERYLAPSVPFRSLAQMMARHTLDAIFDGPALDHGFIDDEELAAAKLRTEIHLSDIMRIIMNIEGVRAIRDIVVTPEGEDVPSEERWVIPVDSGKKALLNEQGSRLVFSKNGLPITANFDQATADHLETLREEAARAERPSSERMEDRPIPPGRVRDTGTYESIQNHFPEVYGLGPAGLGNGATPHRESLARQLKAYLLFFDQILADYLAHLHHVRDLFSIDPDVERACFHQVVDSLVDYTHIYAPGTQETIREMLDGLDEHGVHSERRNRFLDHLIARFSERFSDFVSIMRSAFGVTSRQAIRHKCRFLQNYPQISRDRGLAWNHTLQDESAPWESDNVSGLEHRLAGLLGIVDATRRNLSNTSHTLKTEIYPSGATYRFRIFRDSTSQSVLLSSIVGYGNEEQAREALELAIQFAQHPFGYLTRVTQGKKHRFIIATPEGVEVAHRNKSFDSVEEMEAAIEETVEYFQACCSDEGMHLIENILLRPQQEDDPFLPICPAPSCGDCSQSDPYSYRIHVLLPAYGARFSNMEFRTFVENTIREETPAHILPKVCWLNREDMALIEAAYQDWVDLKAGRAEADERVTRIQTLIDSLYKARSIYPPGRLHACDGEGPHFVLGRTALGTMEQS